MCGAPPRSSRRCRVSAAPVWPSRVLPRARDRKTEAALGVGAPLVQSEASFAQHHDDGLARELVGALGPDPVADVEVQLQLKRPETNALGRGGKQVHLDPARLRVVE